MDPLLVYPASDLDTGGKPVQRDLPPAWLADHLADVEATATAPGRVEGRLSRSGIDDVVVRAEVRADVSVPCARCLAPAPVSLRGELSLLLRPGKVLPEPARAVPAKAAAAADGHANGNGKKKGKAAGEGPGTRAIEAARTVRAGKAAAATRPERRASGGAFGARSAEAKLPEYEFSASEAEYDLYDGETVVLDPFVREALLLEMPNFPLCSEDCPGIAHIPAQAGNTPAEAGSPSEGATGTSGGEADRPPGTRSLGDALRAALAAKTTGKPKKR